MTVMCMQDPADPVAGSWDEGSGARQAVEPAGSRDPSSPAQNSCEGVPRSCQPPLPAAGTAESRKSHTHYLVGGIAYWLAAFVA